jgi:NADPH:quinone reductase-like Zn-dependent oxidoreductase
MVIGTVSSDEKARVARDHGCNHVIITRDYSFAEAVKYATGGHGADLIVDGLGEKALGENLAALAMFGHWVSVGQASGALPDFSPDALTAKSATFSRPVVFHYAADAGMLESGKVRPLIGGAFALAAASEAHRVLEARTSKGSLVLIP